MASFRSALLFVLTSIFISFDDLISIPSCQISNSTREIGDKRRNFDDLTVMMVADLMLKGPDEDFVDRWFRDRYISKFLKKSLDRLQPDLLVILGDLAAKGSLVIASKWLTILQQFQGMLGSFVGTPVHIVLGDSDIGECSKLDASFVSQIASNLPGMNSAGCGAFEISNISFISLNSVALLCGNNDLRFGVEKVIESEHLDLQTQTQGVLEESTGSNRMSVDFNNFHWRQNNVASGSGPVLLLHLPLHRTIRSNYCATDIIGGNSCDDSSTIVESGIVDTGPYYLTQTLPPNATEYLFHSLRPWMIFSAHAHRFCDYYHTDGTREVIVPSMSWATKGRPGFVVATFGLNKEVKVEHCYLPKESHVIMAYLSLFFLLMATTYMT